MFNVSLSGTTASGDHSSDEASPQDAVVRHQQRSVSPLPPASLVQLPDIETLFPESNTLASYQLQVSPQLPLQFMATEGEDGSPDITEDELQKRRAVLAELAEGRQSPDSPIVSISGDDPATDKLPYTNRDEFIDHCYWKLTSDQQAEFKKMIDDDSDAIAHNFSECEMNVKAALQVFVLYQLKKYPTITPGTAASRVSSRLVKGDRARIGVETIKQWFTTDDPKELYAYGCLFGGVKHLLKAQASKLSSGRRNATYWLIKLMEHDNIPANSVAGYLNRAPNSVPCPFADKWNYMNAYQMCREVTTQSLLKQLEEAHERNTRPSQQLMLRADRGDREALDGFIHYYHDQRGYRNSDIAAQLRSRVKIPGHDDTKNWQAHMIHQYLSGDPITLEEPQGYREVIFEARLKTRHIGSSRIVKKEIKSERASKGSGKKKLLRHSSSSSDSDFDLPGTSGWSERESYPMRSRHQIPGSFGALMQAEDSSSDGSGSEEEFTPELSQRAPGKKSKGKQPLGKKQPPKRQKLREEQPAVVKPLQPETVQLDYATMDFKLLVQLAKEKDLLATAHYIKKLGEFVDSDQDIIDFLRREYIRPEKGRWSVEELRKYRALCQDS